MIKQGRHIDLPYFTSPPILFVYQQTANLDSSGNYVFSNQATPAAFTPNRPLNANVLYVFTDLAFSTDIAELDYAGAVTSAMSFSMYMQSGGTTPILREMIPLLTYVPMPYRLSVLGEQAYNPAMPTALGGGSSSAPKYNGFTGKIAGTLLQTPSLLGKASITATLVFSVQEVSDGDYIEAYRLGVSTEMDAMTVAKRHGRSA